MTAVDITNPQSVLVHALQRRARHRRPSAVYRRYGHTITNPREAVRAAAKGLLEAEAGEHISNYCRRLAAFAPLFARLGADKRYADRYTPHIFDVPGVAHAYGAAVGRFNDVYLTVDQMQVQAVVKTEAGYKDFKGLVFQDLALLYDMASEARYKAYQESPKGLAAAQQRTAEVRRHAAYVVELVEELRSNCFDPKNLSATLAWWYRYTQAADYTGVLEEAGKQLGSENTPRYEIVQFFLDAGFEADAEIIDEDNIEIPPMPETATLSYEEWTRQTRALYVQMERAALGEDEERMARYIVGQCISMTRLMGVPHPVATVFIGRWYLRFKYLPILVGLQGSNPKLDPIYQAILAFDDPGTLRDQLHDVIDRLDLVTAFSFIGGEEVGDEEQALEDPKQGLKRFVDRMLSVDPDDFDDEEDEDWSEEDDEAAFDDLDDDFDDDDFDDDDEDLDD